MFTVTLINGTQESVNGSHYEWKDNSLIVYDDNDNIVKEYEKGKVTSIDQ